MEINYTDVYKELQEIIHPKNNRHYDSTTASSP